MNKVDYTALLSRFFLSFKLIMLIMLIKKMRVFFDQLGRFRPFLLLVLLVGLLAACVEDGPESTAEPTITLSPQSGGENTAVIVTGENFPAGTVVTLRLGPPDVGATPFSYGTAVVDGAGRFKATFMMPDRWPDGNPIAETALTVIAINEDGSVKATAPFAFGPGLVSDPAQTIDGVMTPDPLLVANEQAIVMAVMKHLVETGESTQAAVAVDLLEGEYARVSIVPVTPDSEGEATGYLKLVDSVWEVLVVGRDFDSGQLLELGVPEFMIPEELLTPEG